MEHTISSKKLDREYEKPLELKGFSKRNTNNIIETKIIIMKYILKIPSNLLLLKYFNLAQDFLYY